MSDTAEVIAQVKEQLGDEYEEYDDAAIGRFIKEKGTDAKLVATTIKNDKKWRQDMDIDNLSILSVCDEILKDKFSLPGIHDKQGRPVILLKAARHDFVDFWETKKVCVYLIEQAIKQMPDGVTEVVLIDDLDGFKNKHNDNRMTKFLLETISNHYPGRVGLLLCISTPTLFNLIFKIIKPWLGGDLLDKVHLYPGVSDLKKYFDPEQLLPEWKGTAPAYVPQEFVEARLKDEGKQLSDKETHVHNFADDVINLWKDQSVADLSEGCTRKGWLKKQGGYVKSYNKRYCILKGPLLYYFKDEKDGHQEGVVPLKNATITEIEDYTMDIVTEGGKHCIFSNKDINIYEDWYDEIEKTIKSLSNKKRRKRKKK